MLNLKLSLPHINPMSVNTCFCAAFLFVEVRCGKFDSCASEDSDAVRRGCGPRAAGVGNFGGAVPISHEIVQSGGCATYFDDHDELVSGMWRPTDARTTAGGRLAHRHHAGRPTAASPFRLGSGARAGRHFSLDDEKPGGKETLSMHRRLPSESASAAPGGVSERRSCANSDRDNTVSDCANSDRDNDGARSGHDSGGQRTSTSSSRCFCCPELFLLLNGMTPPSAIGR